MHSVGNLSKEKKVDLKCVRLCTSKWIKFFLAATANEYKNLRDFFFIRTYIPYIKKTLKKPVGKVPMWPRVDCRYGKEKKT